MELYGKYIKNGLRPEECDYYFETLEDFNNRRDAILTENNNDLSQKTFGFGDGVTSLESAFSGTSITSTPKMIVANNLENVDGLFFMVETITKISPDLFKYCGEKIKTAIELFGGTEITEIPQVLFDTLINVTDLENCFSNCTSLTSIPQGLFSKNKLNKSFQNCFYCCFNLITVPFELFDNNKEVTSFMNCFANSNKITSSLPDAWNKKKFPDVNNSHGYAYKCTKAANYNEVPADFGGPAQ